MEPVKVVVHLHRQKKNLDVNGCQIQIPNSSKKCNPSAVIQDDFGNVDTAFQRLKETTTIFDKFLQGIFIAHYINIVNYIDNNI